MSMVVSVTRRRLLGEVAGGLALALSPSETSDTRRHRRVRRPAPRAPRDFFAEHAHMSRRLDPQPDDRTKYRLEVGKSSLQERAQFDCQKFIVRRGMRIWDHR